MQVGVVHRMHGLVLVFATSLVMTQAACAQSESALEPAQSQPDQIYSAWASEHYGPIWQHSPEFEMALYQARLQTDVDQAVSLITSQSGQKFSREEFELLVASVPGTVFSPLLKRLLLGAYFLGPSENVRRSSLLFFTRADAKMRKLQKQGITRAEKKAIYKSASEDLLDFQRVLLSNFPDPVLRARYLKSIARILVAEDRDVLKWTEKIMKQNIEYPGMTWTSRLWRRVKMDPVILITPAWILGGSFGLFNWAIHSADDAAWLGVFVLMPLVTLVPINVMSKVWGKQSNIFEAEAQASNLSASDIQSFKAERKAMIEFMQPDCEEVFTATP